MCNDILRRILVFFACGFFLFLNESYAQQKENLPLDQRATGSIATRSRLAFDPGIHAGNASRFSVSDGSDPLSHVYEPGAFLTQKYIKSDALQRDKKLQKIRNKTTHYYAKEKKKRLKFHDRLQKLPYTQEEMQQKILRYGKKEIKNRKKFTEKQQKKMRKILCQNIEDKKTRKKCERGEL